MADPIIEKAIAKRDAALREAERWEAWIKSYEELTDRPTDSTIDPLDIPGGRSAAISVETEPANVMLTAASEPPPAPLAGSMTIEAEALNGKGMWPRLLGKPIG